MRKERGRGKLVDLEVLHTYAKYRHMTFDSLAGCLGVTRERARQLLWRGFRHFALYLGEGYTTNAGFRYAEIRELALCADGRKLGLFDRLDMLIDSLRAFAAARNENERLSV